MRAACGFLSANVGLNETQRTNNSLRHRLDSGLQSNRNVNACKPATVALVAGHGSRTKANGASLRGVRGMVRAGEDGEQGKWEEMINDNGFSLRKTTRRYASQFPAKLFSFLFSLCNPLK